jgi:hypothetical protein
MGGGPAWGAEGRVGRASGNNVPTTRRADDRSRAPAGVDDDAEDPADARRRRINDDDWFRDRAFREEYASGSVNGEFPSAEVHDYVVANARAATARMVFRRAESVLSAALRGAKRQFEASTELKLALADEKAAHEAYDRARREALAAVVASPRYQAILTMHQDLGEQIVASRRELQSYGQRDTVPVIASPANPEAANLFAMASLRMQVASDARAMEREAEQASEELRAARVRLVEAARKVSELRQDFDNSIREDPDLLAARRVLEDARIGKVATAAYLQGSRMAADQAVDFAYYLHRRDAQVGYDPNYDGYYGYGRYGAYWR